MKYVRDIPYMLWAAVGLHSIIGTALIFSEQAVRFLVLSGLNILFEIEANGSHQAQVLGGSLVAISALAAFGLVQEKRLPRWAVLALLLPQYLVLLLSFVSTLYVIADGDYRGNEFDRLAALSALSATLVIAFLHTAQILDRYALRWSRTVEYQRIIEGYEALSPEAKLRFRQLLNVWED